MSKFQAFEVGGRLFRVTFMTHAGAEVLTPDGSLVPSAETLCCILSAAAPFKLYASGVSACSATDAYDAQEGRWLALQRALSEAEDVIPDWDVAASERLRGALIAADDVEAPPLNTWDDIDRICPADVRETAHADFLDIIDWHRRDARRLGINPSTPEGEVMSMADYHRVYQVLTARQV